MSKIYEALLKAEQEKAAQAGEIVPVEASEDTASAIQSGLSASSPIRNASATAISAVGASKSALADIAQRESVTRSSEPAAANQAPKENREYDGWSEIWKPDWMKLPALQPRGSQVEQFRGLRTKLYEFRSLNTLRSVLISSALPSEGKSFVAVNLAISFALHKSARVLLIDADLRRSTQQKLLGSSNTLGLAEYLAGQVELAQIIRRGTSPDGKPLPPGLASLSIIPAGNAGDKAADLSVNPRFAELVATVSSQFDWIVVDSSPVTLVSDGANFARHCDGVLFVARGGVTKYEAAQRALLNLKSATTVGVVLNAVTSPGAADGYYGYDAYDSVND